MGDLSFYKHRRSGYQARLKRGIDGKRIATDPAFQRTRENNDEFGRAASTSKKIQTTYQGERISHKKDNVV